MYPLYALFDLQRAFHTSLVSQIQTSHPPVFVFPA
ncbi:MAG: hypothetical protein JWQ02_4621 [Capsulimonas sp.]|nr:hypothetical protein [Capsulimonas sp.]